MIFKPNHLLKSHNFVVLVLICVIAGCCDLVLLSATGLLFVVRGFDPAAFTQGIAETVLLELVLLIDFFFLSLSVSLSLWTSADFFPSPFGLKIYVPLKAF